MIYIKNPLIYYLLTGLNYAILMTSNPSLALLKNVLCQYHGTGIESDLSYSYLHDIYKLLPGTLQNTMITWSIVLNM